MKQRISVYAGSFDPVTNGHLWMIKHGKMVFDELIVAVGINPDKRGYFTVEERLELLRQSLKAQKRVRIESFANEFLVNYAYRIGARFILRGIRNLADVEYERGLRQLNGQFRPDITTWFLMPPPEFTDVSSSAIKGMVGPEGWEKLIRPFVPAPVLRAFKEKHNGANVR